MMNNPNRIESINNDFDIEYFILRFLDESKEPVGSGSLFYVLQERGEKISAPTIGRRLRDLEHRGLVRKVSVEGRKLTTSGSALLKKLEHDHFVEDSTHGFLTLLKQDSRKAILDQLMARRVIEGETAALAASGASDKTILQLEDLIERQRQRVLEGEMAVDEDIGFHETIAAASGNNVLASMVHLLRSQKQLAYLVTAIRAKVHTRFVVDHEEILVALKSRESALARQAMETHISKLISDVERYWEQVFP